MANTRSDLITNLFAKVANPLGQNGSRVRYRMAAVGTSSGHPANHLYVMFRVLATDRVISLNISNTADAGMTDLNVGAYVAGDWTLADQVVVPGTAEDRLVDGANRAAATTQPVNIWGTGTNAFAESLQGRPLWQQLGLAAPPQPGTEYDICIRSVGDPAGGGTYVAEMLYVAGD